MEVCVGVVGEDVGDGMPRWECRLGQSPIGQSIFLVLRRIRTVYNRMHPPNNLHNALIVSMMHR